jgi:hypothetical protein
MPFSYEPEYTYDDVSSGRARRKQANAYDVKKLPTLGGMNESFDPKAQDGDGDGLVQEGTAFERPATPIADATDVAGDVIGKPSTTGEPSGQVRAVGNVPGGMQRPTIPVSASERRPLLPTFRKRPKSGSEYQGVYGHALRFRGMSSKEIVERSVPTSVEDMIAMGAEHMIGDRDSWLTRHITRGENVNERDYEKARIKAIAKITARWADMQVRIDTAVQMVDRGQLSKEQFSQLADESGWMKPDFSPETIALMKRELKKALDDSPEFMFAVENFGMPPYVAALTQRFGDGTRAKRNWAGLHNPGLRLVTIDGYRMQKNSDRDPSALANATGGGYQWTIDPTNQGIMRHEFGHWIATQLRSKGESMYLDRNDADPMKAKPFVDKYVLMHHALGNDKPTAIRKSSPEPFVSSEYGQMNNAETLAEAFAAYTSPLDSHKRMINDAAKRLIDGVLGVGSDEPYPWDDEKMSRRTLMRGSGVRASQALPDTRGAKSIADWERPIVTQVGKINDEEMQHRVTLGDHTFSWDTYIDPEEGALARERDAESHFDTESFNGAVKHGGDAWFNREVSALLFGYAPSEPDFVNYGKRGLNADNPEFKAIATGDASKLDDDDKDSIAMALERAFNVMQAISDRPTSDKPLYRLVSDLESLKEGDILPIPTTNFANDLDALPESTRGDFFPIDGRVSTGGAILKITGPHHSFKAGRESITQGNFRIKSISVNEQGNKVIEMEQVETFSPRNNAFKAVQTQGQAAMRALGSRTPINI